MTMPLGRILCASGAALALASCGGDEDPPDLPASAPAGERLTITAREYLFTPNRIALRRPGAQSGSVRQPIQLRNQGELAHNIEVLDGDRVVGRVRSFRGAGQERGLAVSLEPGREYEFICTVADHDQKGMRGTLRVR